MHTAGCAGNSAGSARLDFEVDFLSGTGAFFCRSLAQASRWLTATLPLVSPPRPAFAVHAGQGASVAEESLKIDAPQS